MLHIQLLGGFALRVNAEPCALPSRPAQTLLAYLLLHRAPQRREGLAGLLWPNDAETSARANLRQVLWRLRQAIGPAYVLADDVTLAFDFTQPHTLDVAQLLTPTTLAEAAAAYQGELLPGFYADWVAPEREQLQARFEAVMAQLLEQQQQAGDWAAVTRWAEHWLAHNPAPEAAYCALMKACAHQGDAPGLERAYQRCEQALSETFNIAPAPATQALRANLRANLRATLRQPGQAPPPQPPPVPALPVALTSFIGRSTELATLPQLLTTTRLLTLLGAGGTGKTRLALALSTQQAAHYAGNVWWVPLAPLTEPAQVGPAIAAAFGEPDEATALARLRTQRALLVLDNCEHLIEPCAHVVERWLQTAPQLQVLATSREPLGLTGETRYRVPPLAVPDVTWGEPDLMQLQASDAVQLFVARARAAAPAFALTPQNAPAIALICQRLDGLPLALELAAARVDTLTPAELANRLPHTLTALGQQRTHDTRHRTLTATLDWSYALLTSDEQTLLAQLAVFAHGFTLAAVEAVCTPQAVDLLPQLLAKSLVVAAPQGEATRYRLLEPIRQYAAAHFAALAAAPATRARWLQYFLTWSDRAGAGLHTHEAATWLAAFAAERDNLRATLAYAIAHAWPQRRALAQAIGQLWYQVALHTPPATHPVSDLTRARTAYLLAALQTDPAQARARLTEARQLFLAAGMLEDAARCEQELGLGEAG